MFKLAPRYLALFAEWVRSLHRCRPTYINDSWGIRGECQVCGKRYGFVSHDEIRQIIEAQFKSN